MIIKNKVIRSYDFLFKLSIGLFLFVLLNSDFVMGKALRIETLDSGIHFEHGLTWKEIIKKAKIEKKFIFLDCYTSWCGPCKMMDNNIFPLAKVGSFFKENFISVKVQIDQTPNDNEEIKNWYKDALSINNKYPINGYPTYLYFDPNGVLVHKSIGYMGEDEFLRIASEAINPLFQYYTLVKKYADKEVVDLNDCVKIAKMAEQINDISNANYYSNKFFSQKSFLSISDIPFLIKFTKSSNCKGFKLLKEGVIKIDSLLGLGTAFTKIYDIIYQEEFLPKIIREDSFVDWQSLEMSVNEISPQYSEEILAVFKLRYYMIKNNKVEVEKLLQSFVNKYELNLDPDNLNYMASYVFNNYKKKEYLYTAKDWSVKALMKENSPTNMDTYANIIYKIGKSKAAISIENQAVLISKGRSDLVDKLNKMKAGQPTWHLFK